MAAANDKEEIIEKKASAPVATSCLIIACVALIGAVALQITEIAAYRSGSVVLAEKDPGQTMARASLKKLQAQVKEILGASPESGGGEAKEEPTLDQQAPEGTSADTSAEPSKEAEKEAAPEAKEAGKEAGKDEAAKETEKEAAPEDAEEGKEAGKEAGKAAEEPAEKDAAADADASSADAPAEEAEK